MREETEGAHSGDAGGAAGPAGSDAGRHPAKQAHQNPEEDLDVHEVPSGRDKLQRDCPRYRGDKAYGGEVVRDDLWDAGAGVVKCGRGWYQVIPAPSEIQTIRSNQCIVQQEVQDSDIENAAVIVK